MIKAIINMFRNVNVEDMQREFDWKCFNADNLMGELEFYTEINEDLVKKVGEENVDWELVDRTRLGFEKAKKEAVAFLKDAESKGVSLKRNFEHLDLK